MKLQDILATPTAELYAELDRVRRHLYDLRSQAVTEKLADPTQVGKTRRDIARILTVLRQRGETEIEQHELHLKAAAGRQKSPPAARQGGRPAERAGRRP